MTTPETPAEVLADITIKPTITREEAQACQRWAGMDGATAWHLIDRHADNWADVGLMMDAWLEANRAMAAGKVDVSDALAYSRNYATANPSLSATTKEHILGLCDLLERVSTAPPADSAKASGSAPDVTPDILRIPAGDKLDAIIVYFEDEGAGKGRMTVACYGDAWTAWWGSMGDRTVRQFVAGVDAGYLSGALLQLRAANAMHRDYTWRVAARVINALQQEGKSHDQ